MRRNLIGLVFMVIPSSFLSTNQRENDLKTDHLKTIAHAVFEDEAGSAVHELAGDQILAQRRGLTLTEYRKELPSMRADEGDARFYFIQDLKITSVMSQLNGEVTEEEARRYLASNHLWRIYRRGGNSNACT